MCDDRPHVTREWLLPRPQWAALYAIVVLGGSSAVAIEVFSPAGVVRTALRWGVVVGGSVAIALWVRLNRVSLDGEQWCACAVEKMTVRVIGPPAPFTFEGAPARPRPDAGHHQEIEQHEILAR
jgi:hypothetical protein